MTITISELSAGQVQAAERIDALDLEPITYKLIHPEPGETAVSLAEADEWVSAYRCFLKLCAWYPESVVPSKQIDQVWHTHILDTAKYAADCERVFGFFVHHFPYFGMRGAEDAAALQAAFERTRELFRLHFGIDPGMSDLRCSNACQVGKCSGTQCNQGSCHGRAADAAAQQCVMCESSSQCHTGGGGSCRASAALDQIRPRPMRVTGD